MAEAGALHPLTGQQAHASHPRSHVWLSASAGTGKTAVLSARVLRLLLNDVAPERILCLTFTKAGAAEMAERVHSRLARWVQVDDDALFKDLEALGEESGPDARKRARLPDNPQLLSGAACGVPDGSGAGAGLRAAR